MGVETHYDRKNCYVYAKLPGEEPAIGFIAHMDTSPAASGANVHPRIEENYQGHSILLFKGHAIRRVSLFINRHGFLPLLSQAQPCLVRPSSGSRG